MQSSSFRHDDGRPPPPLYPSLPSNLTFLPENPRYRKRAADPEMVRSPSERRAMLLRELEKERIRKAIIAEEIALLRRFEEEARRSLMLERELALARRAAAAKAAFPPRPSHRPPPPLLPPSLPFPSADSAMRFHHRVGVEVWHASGANNEEVIFGRRN